MRKKTREDAAVDSEIAYRLKNERVERGVAQAALATAMGLSRDQLASVEMGRVPLRFWPAVRAAEFLKVSLRWLTTGIGPKQQKFIIHLEKGPTSTITERTSITAGFAECAEAYSELEALLDPFPFEERAHEAPEQRSPLLDAPEGGRDHSLTIPADKFSLWGQLRLRLLAATVHQGRGSRSALARTMGVSRQAVTEWLSGLSSPGAEITLRLQEWVKAAEDGQRKEVGRLPDSF